MNPFAPRRAVLLTAALTVMLLSASPALADDGWAPATSLDKFKVGQSGQVYRWRPGEC